MRNLLHDLPSVGEVQAILERGRRPIFPGAPDPAWERVGAKQAVQEWLRQIRARASDERDIPMPVLTDELYEDFHKTGRGLPFSQPYFERRRRLSRAVVCTLFDEESARDQARYDPRTSRWWPSLMAKLEDVLGEVAWAIPAHVGTPTGKDPMEIDLFAAETANLMGEILTLFEPYLADVTTHRIRERLREQFVDNYLNRDEFRWSKGTSNWNAVCHHGVLGAALACEPDERRVAQLLHKAAGFLPFFLRGFTSDGGCSEGPGYWEYGFGSFSILNDQLERATAHALSWMDGDEQVRAIARYAPRMSLIEGRLVNFADCRPHGPLRPFLFQYLGQRLREEECLEQAAANYWEVFRHPLNIDAQRCDISFLLRLFWYCPDEVKAPPLTGSRTVSFPQLQVLVHKGASGSRQWVEFSGKGGHNAEHHNHNDLGSFLLHVDGRPLVCEIGGPEYTRQYLRENRYDFIAARSMGHSVPLINGVEQAPGREYCATPGEPQIAGHHVAWKLDLTKGYPPAAHCRSCTRTFTYDGEKGELEVKDAFLLALCDSLETALITVADVERTSAGAILVHEGRQLDIICGANTRVSGVERHDYRTGQGQRAFVRRVSLAPEAMDANIPFALSYTLRIIDGHG